MDEQEKRQQTIARRQQTITRHILHVESVNRVIVQLVTEDDSETVDAIVRSAREREMKMEEQRKRRQIARHLWDVKKRPEMEAGMPGGREYIIGYAAGFCSALKTEHRTYEQFKRILIRRFAPE